MEGRQSVDRIQWRMQELHMQRACAPCYAIVKGVECKRGDQCMFCHAEHPDFVIQPRPAKIVRQKIEKRISELYFNLSRFCGQ